MAIPRMLRSPPLLRSLRATPSVRVFCSWPPAFSRLYPDSSASPSFAVTRLSPGGSLKVTGAPPPPLPAQGSANDAAGLLACSVTLPAGSQSACSYAARGR
ncbi:hypothetical protein FKM82_013890 [Ascaphus truei]